MIELFGLRIHDPDVALTDLALAVEAALLALLMHRRGPAAPGLRPLLVALFLALAASSLLGGLYHGIIPPGSDTAAAAVAWRVVTAAIGVVAAVVWLIDARLIGGTRLARRARPLAALYLAAFVAIMALGDARYSTVIALYVPPLLLLTGIAAARLAALRSRAWALVLLGLLLSFAAAALQLLGVAIHPRWFDANAVYHVVQGIALAVLFFGFRSLDD